MGGIACRLRRAIPLDCRDLLGCWIQQLMQLVTDQGATFCFVCLCFCVTEIEPPVFYDKYTLQYMEKYILQFGEIWKQQLQLVLDPAQSSPILRQSEAQ